ncbi:MAG: hypothetical protein OXI63_05285 [Candidatus Poribacteria bacterium]|nr:hypothetical protein [Candidatus Poribacteria bacterium]
MFINWRKGFSRLMGVLWIPLGTMLLFMKVPERGWKEALIVLALFILFYAVTVYVLKGFTWQD